jgi:hypothetical protein
MRGKALLVALMMLAVFGAACGNDPETEATDSSSQDNSDAELEGSNLDAAGASPVTYKYKFGSASVVKNSDAAKSLNHASSSTGDDSFGSPTGSMKFSYERADGAPSCKRVVLTISGASFTGTKSTSSSLNLSYLETGTIRTGCPNNLLKQNYSSSAGECSITISDAASTQAKGSFTCTNVPLAGYPSQKVAALSGSFSATP